MALLFEILFAMREGTGTTEFALVREPIFADLCLLLQLVLGGVGGTRALSCLVGHAVATGNEWLHVCFQSAIK